MEKTLIICDKCGKSGARKLSFAVDSQMDGAGDTDEIHERVDLCDECSHAQLEVFIMTLPWSARKDFAQSILKSKVFYEAVWR